MKISPATLLALLAVAISPACSAPVAVPVPIFRRGPDLVTKWDTEVYSAPPVVHAGDPDISDEEKCGCCCETCTCKEIDVSTLPIHLAYEIIKCIGHVSGVPQTYDQKLSTRENNWKTVEKCAAEATLRLKHAPVLIIEKGDNIRDFEECDVPKIVIPSLVVFDEDCNPITKHVRDNDVVVNPESWEKPRLVIMNDDISRKISPLYKKPITVTIDDEEITVNVDDDIGYPIDDPIIRPRPPIKSRPLPPIQSPPVSGIGRPPKYNLEPIDEKTRSETIYENKFLTLELMSEDDESTHNIDAAGRAPKPADSSRILELEDFPVAVSKPAIKFDSEIAPNSAGTRVTGVSPNLAKIGQTSRSASGGTSDTDPVLLILDEDDPDEEVDDKVELTLNAPTQKSSKWVCCKKGNAPTPGHPPEVALKPVGTRVTRASTGLVKIGQTL